jgi:hypothetical protein
MPAPNMGAGIFVGAKLGVVEQKPSPRGSLGCCRTRVFNQRLVKLEFDQLRWWGGEKIKKWGKKPHKK